MFMKFEDRLRVLENYKSRATGYVAALGAIGGLIAGILTKLI